ncbi:hypothetical protein [Streptomyces sp. NBC_01235]|uniref:hypothetical protein n=1 Tax=Streptomyces sp. NBC_01235 TaxID=2903788 RepID=UPI002E16127B|nr:hypothetical protein OG289_48810 [Streptomyces sp. NBC_01235]
MEPTGRCHAARGVHALRRHAPRHRGTAHLQARALGHGLELGNRSVDILARVQSTRAKDYVAEFNAALAPLAARASRP